MPEVAPSPAPGQVRMTLEERMALRQKMVLETVQEVLTLHGLIERQYRIQACKSDDRGHQYSVMIDLVLSSGARSMDSMGEWKATEAQISRMTLERYRIKVGQVYWRVEVAGGDARPDTLATGTGDHADDSIWPAPRPADSQPAGHGNAPGDAPLAVADAHQPTGALAAMLRRHAAAKPKQDDFPDTEIQVRTDLLDGVSNDELLAFEAAIREGQATERPLKLGRRTYQTDFMPLE